MPTVTRACALWLIRRLPGLVAGCLCLMMAGAAAAQDYEAAVERGVQEFSAGNWEEACVNFELAHQLRPGPRPLRGLGMCLYEQKRYAESVSALGRALSLADAEFPLTEEMAESARTLLQTARQYVVELTVTVHPEGAKLTLDGRPATPGTLFVNSGEHELVATHGGREEVRRLEVRLGEQLTIDLRVEPQAPSRAAVPGTSAAASAAPAIAVEGPQPAAGVAPIVAFAVGGAGLLTMGIFGTMALSEYGHLEDTCGKGCSDSQVSTLETYTLAADIGLGFGLLGTAIGVWLWQTAEPSEYGSTVLPMLGPDRVGVLARGSL